MASSGDRLIELNFRIAETEKRIARQRKTVERMGREGRDARTAAFVLDYFLSSLDKMVREEAELQEQAVMQRDQRYPEAA